MAKCTYYPEQECTCRTETNDSGVCDLYWKYRRNISEMLEVDTNTAENRAMQVFAEILDWQTKGGKLRFIRKDGWMSDVTFK